ncbi:MAG: NUDIX hydrolase [Alphaproteobacteria bacterium]
MQPKTFKTEAEFLKAYDANSFDRPNVSVDTVIFTVSRGHLQALIMQREHYPSKGQWSLVGGFIDVKNDAELIDTAKRKLEEKTGVKTPYLEQFGSFGSKTRDPRGWSVTNVYFALISAQDIVLQSGQGATDIKWSVVEDGKVKEKLAFDHAQILEECTERLRSKVLYTSLPVHLMPEEFTLAELQNVYQIIMGGKMDHKSFRRRILGADILEETGNMKDTGRRPAMLYQKKKTEETHFFVRNIGG